MIGASRLHGSGWREQIDVAHRVIGDGIMARLGHVQYVAGLDPVFSGVHPFETTRDGRSYRDTACCCYPWHIIGPRDRRVTTVVLPSFQDGWRGVKTIVHELGHALDESIGRRETVTPVSTYARTDRDEAFAEAFTRWCWGPLPGYDRVDDKDRALFQSLWVSA